MTDQRNDIPAKYKWDLTAIYPDMDAFEADFKRAKELVDVFPRHAETMTKSAEGLYEMLKEKTELERIIEKLFIYAHLNSDLDLSDNYYLSLMGRMQNLACEAGSASFFVSPSLLRLDEKTTEGLINLRKKFEETLSSLEITPIDPTGQAFDPLIAEAVMQVEKADGEESDVVKQVFQKGYKFKEKIIRYAKVSVTK